MAHFIGYLQGNRGEASRLGSKESGMAATAQGWNIGGRVSCDHVSSDEEGEKIDRVSFNLNAGSGAGKNGVHLLTVETTSKEQWWTITYCDPELIKKILSLAKKGGRYV